MAGEQILSKHDNETWQVILMIEQTAAELFGEWQNEWLFDPDMSDQHPDSTDDGRLFLEKAARRYTDPDMLAFINQHG